jgi:hypothetical protein
MHDFSAIRASFPKITRAASCCSARVYSERLSFFEDYAREARETLVEHTLLSAF